VLNSVFIKDVGVYYSVVPTDFVGLLFASFILGLVAGILGSLILKKMAEDKDNGSNK
jgi:hypothetical protein